MNVLSLDLREGIRRERGRKKKKVRRDRDRRRDRSSWRSSLGSGTLEPRTKLFRAHGKTKKLLQLVRVHGDVLVKKWSGKLEEGEGDLGRPSEGLLIAEAKDVMLGFEREGREKGGGEGMGHVD